MRSITLGSVMKATMRISSLQRGHLRGSTSMILRSNSAHLRFALRSASGSGSTIVSGSSAATPFALRRVPLWRDE